jgi:NAD(P)-dependent dehydrogenase (short-subunit alcohol dehydrogenase family)
MKLRDKVGLVTGSAQGIGRGIAMRMAEEGANVILSDINEVKLRETYENDIRRIYGGAEIKGGYFKLDVTSEKEIEKVVDEIIRRYEKLDILVNSAGVLSSYSIVELDEEEWDRVINVNLKGTFLLTKVALKRMMRRRQGRIINIASDCGITGRALQSHYCSSKFGVIGFTQSAALEAAEYNILVNAVCPGPVDTALRRRDVAMKAKVRGISFEDLEAKENSSIPLGKRPGKPEEVGEVVVFLASDLNTFITGEKINVSGGLELH